MTGRRATRPKLLLISHDASRTGAPVLLLRLLEWLTRTGEFEPVVLAAGGGPLLDDYRALARVVTSDVRAPTDDGPLAAGVGRVQRRARRTRVRAALRRLGPFDVACSGTLVNGASLRAFLPEQTPVLTVAGELQHLLTEMVSGWSVAYALQRSSHVAAVSGAVRRELIENHSYPASKITVVPGFVRTVPADAKRLRATARRQLGIPDSSFVVGGVGSLGWHKGSDLFLQVARLVPDAPSLEFVWFGGEGRRLADAEHDRERCGLGNLRFLGPVDDAPSLMAAFDVLLLPSRVDSYPLVMLEAAAVRVPTICFAESGGAPEFTATGGGVSVPYLDVAAMAASVRELMGNPARLAVMGERAREVVAESHTVDAVGPRISTMLHDVAGGLR